MNLQSLQALKLQAVAQLLAVAETQMFASKQLRDAQGQPRRIWVKASDTGYSTPLSIENSSLAPVHAICAEGIVQNGYGNAYIRTWDKVGIEDVLRMTELVQAEVQRAAAPAAVATPAAVAVPAGEAWAVEDVSVLDRHHTMFTVRAKQQHADGSQTAIAFSVQAKRAVNNLLPALKNWTPGNLQAFLSQLTSQGHEVSQTQSA